MNWKNWPYWVKGAIAMVTLVFIIQVTEILICPRSTGVATTNNFCHSIDGWSIPTVYYPIDLPVKWLIFLVTKFIPYFTIFIFLGSFFGLLYEKIKNRRETKVNRNIS